MQGRQQRTTGKERGENGGGWRDGYRKKRGDGIEICEFFWFYSRLLPGWRETEGKWEQALHAKIHREVVPLPRVETGQEEEPGHRKKRVE